MKSGILHHFSPIQRKSPMRRISKRQRARLRIRQTYTLPAVRKRSGGDCELKIPRVCTGQAAHGHEPLLRSQGGDITDPDQVLDACPACHRWVHAHPKLAAKRGLIITKRKESTP